MKISNKSVLNKTNQLPLKKAIREDKSTEPKDEVKLSGGEPKKDWTLLFYLDGNSSLSRVSLSKLRDLERVGSSDKMNIVTQVSRPKKPVMDFITGDWSGTRRYYVTKNPSPPNDTYKAFHTIKPHMRPKAFMHLVGDALDEGKEKGLVGDGLLEKAKFVHGAIKKSPYNSIPAVLSDTRKIHSEVLSEEGKVAMSSPETLKDFLEWGMKNYPAKHYMVVVQGHGQGAGGVLSDKDGKMSLPDMEKTLKEVKEDTGIKPDVLVFDACLMGGAEVAYQMKDTADIMIASQEVERGYTIPYEEPVAFLEKALKEGEVSPGKLAKKLVSFCQNNHAENFTPTMSATNLKEMNSFGKSLDAFAKALSEAEGKYGEKVDKLISSSQHFDLKYEGEGESVNEKLRNKLNPSIVKGYTDLYDFASKISKSSDLEGKKLKESADNLVGAFSKIVIENETTGENYKNAHGLSIFLPENAGKFKPGKLERYKGLAISQDTGWDEFITNQ